MTIHKIPKHGRAGVAFAGVALTEAAPLIASMFIGLIVGSFIGWIGYLGFPFLGYVTTKLYLEWKKGRLPGYLAAMLYKAGISPYSKAFDKPNKIFIGNSVVINPGSKEFIDAAVQQQESQEVDKWN